MRVKKLRDLMEKEALDYVILSPGSNTFYLTGFFEEQMERPLFLIISKDDEFFLAPKLYEEQLEKTKIATISYEDGENPYSKLTLKTGSSIGVDDQLWSVFLIQIINNFKPSKIIEASKMLRKLRAIKDEQEISTMKEGIKIAEKSFLQFLDYVTEGIPECKLANILEEKFIENGADGYSFKTILTSGPNTSMPHLRCTDRKINRNEPIIVDFGVKYKNYSTDTTRVVSIGNVSEDVKKVYEIVKEAQISAENGEENMTAMKIDSLAREKITMAGYGKFFIHRTGHGIGIDVHEDPYISQDNLERVTNGMIFTVEPGIYVPGKFGIRIEDMVFMEKRGKPLNSLEKNIFIV
ncbi:X-pro aminopeptidase [Candidatus Acidianus copahuensis]|uniref:X-pro aminopeptidase n=1 Tax=Candidatus Acidianus copahuensis TaxID=1160895 RepID=A0A031LUP5_9CREN|nr:Xaa-Pro peptidase family protein [Candidatus Acidianus copahuensis]EZQ10873.1 X-pro aminopeptidase [Candidatus Acidianus copahuensis]